MKARILVYAAVFVTIAGTAWSQSVNFKGVAFAPIAVGTTTPVVILVPKRSRCAWTMTWTETANLTCAPITGAETNTTPLFTPSATAGFKFTGPTGVGGWTDASITGDPSMGWSCVASAPANVSTYEEAHCLYRPIGP